MHHRRFVIGLCSAICLVCVACSSDPAADDANPSTGGTAAGGTHSQAGTAGAAGGGSPGAGGTAVAGESSVGVGGDGEPEAGAGGVAGQVGAAGAGGDGIQGGAGAGAGGSAPDEPRPECEVVGKIDLENLRVVEEAGPGEQAELRLDVHNGSEEFVNYNGIKVTCVGDAVEFASDQLGVFGLLPGDSIEVTIYVTFTDSAMSGDIAECTVRAFELTAPDDCANAETLPIDVTVQ